MSSIKFNIPLLEEEDNMKNGKSQISSGTLFMTHRQEIKNNIQSKSPHKSLKSHENTNLVQTGQSKKSLIISESSKTSGNDIANIQQGSIKSHNLQTACVSTPKEKVQESVQPAAGSPIKSSNISKAGLITVSSRQRGNPVLKFIRNVAWEYGDIIPDYEMGKVACALFLSLRYHNLNPQYIHERLKQLGRSYDLRVLLVQVDVKDPHHALKELAKICILSDVTLIVAFSAEEVGRYLETYKAYENKPPDLIMEKTETNFLSQFTDCMTSTRKVNKTDAMTLLTTFGSFEKLVDAEEEDLSLCPGFGPQKAKRLCEVLNEPFLKANKRTKGNAKAKGGKSESQPSTSEIS